WSSDVCSSDLEPPELLHFGDPLDGCANDFGIGRHAQELLGTTQRALVHEEGSALQWCSPSHAGLQARHLDRHTFYVDRHTVNVSAPIRWAALPCRGLPH